MSLKSRLFAGEVHECGEEEEGEAGRGDDHDNWQTRRERGAADLL